MKADNQQPIVINIQNLVGKLTISGMPNKEDDKKIKEAISKEFAKIISLVNE